MELDKGLLIQLSIKILIFIIISIFVSRFAISEYKRLNSIAYKKSLELLRNNESVTKLLGGYIRRDWLMKGSPFPIKENGVANFSYSVVGSKNRAKVYVNAVQHENTLSTIEVRIKIGKENNEILIN